MLFVVRASLLAAVATAYRLPTSSGEQLSRRSALSSGIAAAFATTALPAFAVELKPCPKGANNCYSSASEGKNKVATWSWPAGIKRDDALKQLSAIVDGYPQSGQSGVDLGGWSFADDQIASTGYARLEFKSGIGNLAKFFNGGKPFTDDLEFNVESGGVCIRSSSRVGDSDFGVNAKRVNWIADKLREKGWNAPGVQSLS